MVMTVMSCVHEQLHKRARENEKVGQEPKCVREVLGPQEDASNHKEAQTDEESARCPEAPL
jgi:hypothetical protein